jgi:signal transduction histidine kinase
MQATATRMTTEEQLVEHVARLARKTEALDDFAGLVAHDVKSSLITALRDEDPREGVTRSLELVDSILEAVRADQAVIGVARVADCVQRAIADLGDARTEIVASATGEFPIPPDALRLVLRNLLANAEINAYSSLTTTASAWPRRTSTPQELNSGCACAIASSNAAAACSSCGREPSAERAR